MTPGANDRGIPDPVEAQAAEVKTMTSRLESSALPRQIAGNMALLIEDVRAVSRVPELGSSVLKPFATKNLTLAL